MKKIRWNLTKTILPKVSDKELLIQHRKDSYSVAYYREDGFGELPPSHISSGYGYRMPIKWIEINN